LNLQISISNYTFGFSKVILQFWKLLIESKNRHFNSLFDLKIDILNFELLLFELIDLKDYISILKTVILIL